MPIDVESQQLTYSARCCQPLGRHVTLSCCSIGAASPHHRRLQLTLTTTPCACRRYLHSKGVVRWLEHPKERENVRLWRWLMEYYLVARWRRCLELLETHDAVGALRPFPATLPDGIWQAQAW